MNTNITVYPATEKVDDLLIVPEEPTEDDESGITDYGPTSSVNRSRTMRSTSQESAKSGFASVVTAIRIARWMARAYGYASQKKALYVPQDQVLPCHLTCNILVSLYTPAP